MFVAKRTGNRKKRRLINIHQTNFSKGYISTLADSRSPRDSLSDMTNIEIVQDGVPRPRPPLVAYGEQPTNTIIGRGSYRYGGSRVMVYMQDDGGTGKIYTQTDGGAMTLVGGTYDSSAWAGFCQSNGKVYVYNGVQKLSYLNLPTNTIVTYTPLPTPTPPSPVKTGLAGTTYTYYYKITANNEVGESTASTAGSVTVGKFRDAWILNTDYVTLTWSAVSGASSYTVYVGDVSGTEYELVTVSGLGYVDDGSLPTNPFKLAPAGNSTDGPIFTHMYNDPRTSQLFGVTADNKLYYSAPISDGTSADFSPYNGGGWVAIDENGDTTLNYVSAFRNGKGDAVIFVSSRGAAGKGVFNNVVFASLTIGDQTITYPNVYEANGQAGTYSARAVIRARDSLYYPTGMAFKTTGTSQNVINILTTSSMSQTIEDDVANINLDNIHKAVGVEWNDKLIWALPVGTTENSEIWYCDLARKNLWVLRWPIAAKDLWTYEDNSGTTHFCALVNNEILEFTRAGSSTTQDNGVAWRSRCAFSSLVWDEDGITLANIYRQYFKLLQPRGDIAINAYGLSKGGITNTVASETYNTSTTFTGYGVWDYSGDYLYGEDVGEIDSYGQSVAVITLKPRGLLNQLDWEIVTEGINCDYQLSSVNTRGKGNDNLIYR